MSRQVLCIDFDGTIVENAFPQIGKLKPNVVEVLQKLNEKYDIVISSCRTSKEFEGSPERLKIIQDMINCLIDNKIPYKRIDMGDEGKVIADYYIDDRAISFNSKHNLNVDGSFDWEEILEGLTGERL